MSSGFDSLLEQAKHAFKSLLAEPLIPVKDASNIPDVAGIYVFYEEDEPLRVGTSKKLGTRIKQHHGSNYRNAAFAKLLARKATGIRGSNRQGEGWKNQVVTYRELSHEFKKAGERIREMSVRWVEESDADCRYLLEFYAAKELGTPHNQYNET